MWDIGILLECLLQICVLCALYVMIGLCVFSCFQPVLGGAVLPVALDGSGWVSSLSVALDVVGVCCVLLLHLCNLVLVLFGDGSFFLIGLGNTFFFLVWAQRPP